MLANIHSTVVDKEHLITGRQVLQLMRDKDDGLASKAAANSVFKDVLSHVHVNSRQWIIQENDLMVTVQRSS
jgi:phosphoribosylformylglycinamidine (FGAM) synthase-like enzyme